MATRHFSNMEIRSKSAIAAFALFALSLQAQAETSEATTPPATAPAPQSAVSTTPAPTAATTPVKTDPALESAPANATSTLSETAELRALVKQMSERIETLERKLTEVSTQASYTPTAGVVAASPSATLGTTPIAARHAHDPDQGFVNDPPISAYRHAMIFFESKKYSEAILEFTSFLERFADHPLAAQAQLHIGDAYLAQNQSKLAITEYQRVITSYDRSSAISSALQNIASAEEKLGLTEDAAKHRQLLTAFYPQSPAAEATLNPGTERSVAETALMDRSERTTGIDENIPPTTPRAPLKSSLDGPPPTTTAYPETVSEVTE